MKSFWVWIAALSLILLASGCSPTLAPEHRLPPVDTPPPEVRPRGATTTSPAVLPLPDLEKIADYLPQGIAGYVPAVRTVLIDPGHGGEDSGAKGEFAQEKNLNLELAKRLEAELRRRGFITVMTRDHDVFVPLDDRGEQAGRIKADVFVSIHHNASVSKSARGIESYVLRPGEGFEPVAHLRNVLLAAAIQRELLDASPWAVDRGVRAARFRVLVKSAAPASVLVEVGFISNPGEEKTVASPRTMQKSAVAIADGISEYAELVSPPSHK